MAPPILSMVFGGRKKVAILAENLKKSYSLKRRLKFEFLRFGQDTLIATQYTFNVLFVDSVRR